MLLPARFGSALIVENKKFSTWNLSLVGHSATFSEFSGCAKSCFGLPRD
jgi:hypothetical protein